MTQFYDDDDEPDTALDDAESLIASAIALLHPRWDAPTALRLIDRMARDQVAVAQLTHLANADTPAAPC